MKTILKPCAIILLLAGLTACGDTVVHERPVIVQPAAAAPVTPDSVEAKCVNGYDNRTRSCY